MSDRIVAALFYGVMILLPLAAIVARRPRAGIAVKMALAWIAIFAIGVLLVGLFQPTLR